MGTVSLGKSGREDRTVLVFLLEALPAALTLCSFSLSTMGFFLFGRSWAEPCWNSLGKLLSQGRQVDGFLGVVIAAHQVNVS